MPAVRTMGDVLDGWIRREVDEVRGPTRAICLPHHDRALGRLVLRPPAFGTEAVRCQAEQESEPTAPPEAT